MPDAVALTKAIKRAAKGANDASKPVEICFGKVTSVSPLKILVDQKMTLGEAQLILARNVTDFTTEVMGDLYKENDRNVSLKDRKEITVKNGLVLGDKVILFRQQNGQKYIVVDRIG